MGHAPADQGGAFVPAFSRMAEQPERAFRTRAAPFPATPVRRGFLPDIARASEDARTDRLASTQNHPAFARNNPALSCYLYLSRYRYTLRHLGRTSIAPAILRFWLIIEASTA